MPDWISHILIALIIGHLFSVKKKSLLVLGAVLPDIMGKAKMLNSIFGGVFPDVTVLSNYGHSLAAALAASFFVALFFLYPYLKTGFLIAVGSISHLLSDGTTKDFMFSGPFPILWHDQYYIILIITLITYLTLKKFDIRIIKWRQKHESPIQAD